MSADQQAGKGTILLMDDDEGVRFIASRTLEHMGYAVDCAEDGPEAIELHRRAVESGVPYLAVILDLTIPGGMGGAKVLEKLRELQPEVKAFVSSGYPDDPVMRNAAAHGFCGALSKPFRYEDVERVMTRHFPPK